MATNGLSDLLEQSGVGVLIVGEDGIVLYANEAAAQAVGLPLPALVGQPFVNPELGLRTIDGRSLTLDDNPAAEAWRSRQRVPAKSFVEQHRDGTVAILSIGARPLEEGLTGVAVEIAESSRLPSPLTSSEPAHLAAEATSGRLKALAQVGGLLISTEKIDDASAQIAEYACLLFDATASLVLQLDSSTDQFHPVAVGGLDEMPPGLRLSQEDVGPLGLDRPVPVVIDDLAVLSADFFTSLHQAGYSSGISLGLVTDSGCHGILLLLQSEFRPPAEPEVIELRLFGALAAAGLRSAEKRETESMIADTVQRAILGELRVVPGLEYAHVYRSATRGAAVGGDFYDVFGLPDGRIGFLIGDISGKGLDACLLTTVVKNAIRAYCYTHFNPARVLALSNKLAIDVMPDGVFATAVVGLYDPATRRCRYSTAGHPPPVALTERGLEALSLQGPVLGVFEKARYREAVLELGRGDLLFFYTDGLTEARGGGELFGEERLLQFLDGVYKTSPKAILRELLRTVDSFTNGRFQDDMAVVVARIEGD